MEKLKVVLPEKYKNVIKDATIEIVEGNLIITPKELEFKDGDIIYWEHKGDKKNNGIAIFKFKDNKYINLYIDLLSIAGLIYDYPFVTKNEIISRLATEEEKQILFDALEKQGKRWNPETKQIEDILKVGDLAIFWDNDKSSAIISEFAGMDREAFVCKDYRWFNNAIKCISLEQYINFIK